MSGGIVDTTVILHYFRKNAAARTCVDAQNVRLSATSITWMEVMEGTSSLATQNTFQKYSRESLICSISHPLIRNRPCTSWNTCSSAIGRDDGPIASITHRM